MNLDALLDGLARELGTIRGALGRVPAFDFGEVTVVTPGPPLTVHVDLGGGKVAQRVRCADAYLAAGPAVSDHVLVLHLGSGRSLVVDAFTGSGGVASTHTTHTAVGASITDAGSYFTGTNVEAALQELGAGGGGAGVSSVNGETGAVTISAADVPVTDAGSYFAGTNVEAALQELGLLGGGGGGGSVSSVNGNTGVVVLDAADLGLGNVNNTTDLAKPISTATQAALDLKVDLSAVVATNNQTGTAYTLVLTDGGKVVERNNGSANNTTVPLNSSVAFPIGTFIEVWQQGVGQSTIVAASGVTIRVPVGLTLLLRGQYATVSLRKRATNEWVASGDLDVA